MSESGGVVLGVERSLTGKRWEASPADDRLALALSQRHNLSDIVARILVARGVKIDFAEAFLNPSLKSLLPDPSLLKGMDEAVESSCPCRCWGRDDWRFSRLMMWMVRPLRHC